MKDAELAWLAAEIYEDLVRFESIASRHGFEVAHTFDHAGTQAALVRDRNSAAIVFRGTEASHWKMRDIFSNLTWPWPTVWQGAGRVHSGYRRHLSMIGHEALEMAEDVASETPLVVTGHSLGGAISTLFASWYYFDNPTYKLAGLVTFGAPKALDKVAARAIACPVRRYAVKGDFAPHWPPVVGLVHPVPAIPLPPRNRVHGPLRRHTPETYTRALQNR